MFYFLITNEKKGSFVNRRGFESSQPSLHLEKKFQSQSFSSYRQKLLVDHPVACGALVDVCLLFTPLERVYLNQTESLSTVVVIKRQRLDAFKLKASLHSVLLNYSIRSLIGI